MVLQSMDRVPIDAMRFLNEYSAAPDLSGILIGDALAIRRRVEFGGMMF